MSENGSNGAGETASGANTPRVFVCIPTHTTRHLEACLCGLARQRFLPDGVCVTCDGDAPELAACIDEAWSRVVRAMHARGDAPPPLLHASRAHAGVARLNQVRNNGLRAIDTEFRPHDADWIVTLDGDSVMQEDAIEILHGLAYAEVAIPYRVNLSEEATRGVTPEALLDPAWVGIGSLIDADARADLTRRQHRYERQLVARRLGLHRFGLLKAHKPKVIGGHHAVRVRALRDVNGYDEAYEGYGYDDDDLSRRLHEAGARCGIVVERMRAVHLWHPTRAPTRPTDAPGYAIFSQHGRPARCERGWMSPVEQAPVSVRHVPGGT
ncbi:MAG: galactosyltransferase-related protein [Phycisphaerales bacterium]|jgi:cellulose synthase/poly-beta-1,6-N-acetylglucosamine synthase-like glycosyltransferase|nr:galactosyltransferase-related protein [Phycisphaerales bacterium]